MKVLIPLNDVLIDKHYNCGTMTGTMTGKCDSSIVVSLIRKCVEYVQYYTAHEYTTTHRRYI